MGPAAIVNAHRFIFGSRDEADGERLEILNDREGCGGAAPSSTAPRLVRARSASPGAIGEVKKAILKGSARAEPIRHAAAAHG